VRSLALSYNPPRYISRASGRCQLLDPRGGVQRAVGCAARVRRLKSSVPHCVAIFGVGTVCGAPQECAHSNRTAILRLVPPFEGVPAPNPPPVGAVRSHHLQLGPRGGRGARRGAVGPRFPPACPVLRWCTQSRYVHIVTRARLFSLSYPRDLLLALSCYK
jgi:hypothetical protein